MRNKAVLLAIIVVLYFALRTINLNIQPIFCDEGIYIRWAQKIIRSPKENLFISLTDGKTPLFMWTMAPFLKIINDPLIAGRITSVVLGLTSILGSIYLGKRFFNQQTAIAAGMLFATVPFLVFFDRMALTDSLLAGLSFWSLILALEVVNTGSIKKTIALGVVLGLSYLTKTPGIFNFIALPMVLVAAKKKEIKKAVKNLGIASIVGLAIINLLRISSYFEKLSERDKYYHLPISRLWEVPFDPFLGNINLSFDFMTKMMTWPIFILFIFGAFYSLYKREKTNIVILLWGLLPFLALTSLLKVYTARYILPSVVPFIFIAAYSFAKITEKIKNKFLATVTLIILLIPALVFDFHLLADPQNANLPAKEKEGYFEGWTAGYGIKEMAGFIKERAKGKNILLVTAGAFGTLPDGIGIYLFNNSNIEIWYSNSYLEPYVYEAAKEKETYFLVHESSLVQNPNTSLIKEISKPPWKETPSDSLMLFKIE